MVFKNQQNPYSFERRFGTKTLPAVHGPVQPWLSNLAREEGPRKSFDELMDTPLDFSAFMINQLKINTLTPELLADPTFELMKVSCKILVSYNNFLKNTTLIPNSSCRGRKSIPIDHSSTTTLAYLFGGALARYLHGVDYSKRRIIALVTKLLSTCRRHATNHLDWITFASLTNLKCEDRLAFGVSLRMFTRSIVIQRRVEDLQLGVESYQKKLNITKPDTYRSDSNLRDAYTAYSNPRGFIYQNKDKKNKLMRIDELHKFSDGTLDDVQKLLLKIVVKRIRMNIYQRNMEDRG
ncbi:hypothetical protein Tco_0397008 [Tanacetum coccineum]